MVLGRDAIIDKLRSGDIVISSFPTHKKAQEKWIDKWVQPASVDLPTGGYFAVMPKFRHTSRASVNFTSRLDVPKVDPVHDNRGLFTVRKFEESPGGKVLLAPGERMLTHTEDTIAVAYNLAAQVSTRSTVKRIGLDVCGSAGWVDGGYNAPITLEIINDHPDRDIYVEEGIAYAQIIFFSVDGASEEHAYTGHYSGAWDPNKMLPKPLVKEE